MVPCRPAGGGPDGRYNMDNGLCNRGPVHLGLCRLPPGRRLAVRSGPGAPFLDGGVPAYHCLFVGN